MRLLLEKRHHHLTSAEIYGEAGWLCMRRRRSACALPAEIVTAPTNGAKFRGAAATKWRCKWYGHRKCEALAPRRAGAYKSKNARKRAFAAHVSYLSLHARRFYRGYCMRKQDLAAWAAWLEKLLYFPLNNAMCPAGNRRLSANRRRNMAPRAGGPAWHVSGGNNVKASSVMV